MRWTNPHVAALACVVGLAAPGVGGGQEMEGTLLPLEEGALFYTVLGSGDPVVVVHGGPGLDHRYLRPGLDVLAESRALVYYDQRGTGGSQVPLRPDVVNLDAFVDDIDRLRVALGRDRITVLGHSFGGLIAMAFALRHPERTRALLLVSTVEPGSRWRAEAAERAAERRTTTDSEELAEIASSPGFAARDPVTLSRALRVSYRSTLRDPERVNELNLELSPTTARNGQDAARLLGQSMGEVDWWDQLAELEVPTLVVHGAFDPTPVEMAATLAETLPSGRLALLESGHFPYLEAPREMARAVGVFLAGLPR
jgi:proline iminopeptidase